MAEYANNESPFYGIESSIREMLFSYMILGRFPKDWPFEAYNDYLRRQSYSLRCMLFCCDLPFADDAAGHATARELCTRFPSICARAYESFIVCLSFERRNQSEVSAGDLGSVIRACHSCERVNCYKGERVSDITLLAEEYRRLCELVERTGDCPDRAGQTVRLYSLESELLNNIISGQQENADFALEEIARQIDYSNHSSAERNQGYFCFLWRYMDRAIYQKTGLRRTIPEKLSIDSRIQATHAPWEAAEILSAFMHSYAEALHLDPESDAGCHKIIQRAKEYITSNCTGDVSLETVANQVGLSSFYLSKLFKKEEGTNYKEFVIRARMERARNLICQGDMNVSEVARAVGYGNVNYFSKAFKSYFGVTARDLRLREPLNHSEHT